MAFIFNLKCPTKIESIKIYLYLSKNKKQKYSKRNQAIFKNIFNGVGIHKNNYELLTIIFCVQEPML
jgi:hypothetical protein